MDPNEVGNKTKQQRLAIDGIYQNLRKKVVIEETRLKNSKMPALFKKSIAILRTIAEGFFDMYAYYVALEKRVGELEQLTEAMTETKVVGWTIGSRVIKRMERLEKLAIEEKAKQPQEPEQQPKDGYSLEPHENCTYVEGQSHCGHCVKCVPKVKPISNPDLQVVESDKEG